jgi:hypothetical protein
MAMAGGKGHPEWRRAIDIEPTNIATHYLGSAAWRRKLPIPHGFPRQVTWNELGAMVAEEVQGSKNKADEQPILESATRHQRWNSPSHRLILSSTISFSVAYLSLDRITIVSRLPYR